NATAQDVKVTVGGQILPTPFKIISLTGANKNDGNFSGFTSGVHMIGNGRNGTRTVRGTIVLDSLIIPSGVTVNIDMSDVDTTLAGNQSFLPVTIIVDGHVNISGILNVSGISGAPNAAAEAGAKGGIGGPGGGGGGAGAADVGTGGAGGGGFTGGGGGGVDETNIEGVGGIGSGSAGGATGGSVGGYGGNSTSPKAEGGGGGVSGASTGGGGGGGTGFFFGSGGGGGTGSAGGAAGSGGGGGGRQGANAGGGGGFGTAGTTGSGNGGSAHGSAQLVPLTGGSGGGGGGSNALAGGGGGGGGGAVLIVSSQNITIMPTGQILAMGGNGGTVSGTNPGGVGGAGSGGGIVLQASNVSLEGTLDTRAGTVGTAGGGGRIRIDGLDDPVTATLIGLAGSNFTGPAIKSISDTNIAGTSNASASIIVYVQQKSGTNKTVTDLADSNGQFNIAVEWYEGTNYIAVIQNSTVNTYTVMSSAAVATYDFVVVPDTTKPRLNASLNNSVPQQGWVVNMTANVSDNIGLSFCQFIDNQSLPDGGKNFFNKTVTGTKDQCSQNYTIRLSAGNVINFTVIVNDTSTAVAGGNKNQSEYANGVIGQIIEVQAAPADNTFPIVNTSFNVTNATFNDVINFTGNVTDETELLSANITYNMSGSITKVNFSLTGLTAAQVSNATLITGCFETCIINFTMYVTDTNNNVRQNSTLLVVADVTKPVVNTTLNVTNAAVNDVVNFTGNVTDLGGLLSANWTYNLSGVLTKLNYSLSGTSAQVSNITTLTCAETCVVNFTLYVTDTSNNVKQNSTLLVVADATPPVVNTTFNNTNPLTTDVINYTGNVTDLAGLKTANITYNMSGVLTKANYTLSGTSTTVTNTTTITGCVETCVINFTLYVTDTSNNVKQNSTLLVVADVTLPVVNTSLNKSLTNIFQNDIINITANVTDAGGLSFCQFIDNQSLPNGGKNFFNKTVTGNNDQCSQNYTIALAAGNVINFTVVVNDTSTATAGGNKRMNDTIITVVASNTAPVIKLNNASGFAVDPVAGGNSIILISFNVTDEQGVGDINASKAIVNLTLGIRDVAQFRFNISDDGTREFGTCYNHTVSTTVVINCTVIMRYYDNASSNWAINISVQDLSGAVGRNDTFVFTYNSLAAFSINARGVSEEANLNFTTAFLNDQNVAAKAPLLLNNTGNNDFDQINITAAVLVGITTPSETISASSFFVNVTNNTAGNGLALSTIPQVIPGVDDTSNATLLHGPGVSGDIVPYSGVANFKTKGNQSLLSWIDLPSSGLSSQTYNNTWNLTLVDLS
ncbi:hypothetical protein HYV80_05670, partial [Candidatus Woesearchaeota archaeon]|nr:hypothetical protein [Candidatus Woesearchaeota archaeon]